MALRLPSALQGPDDTAGYTPDGLQAAYAATTKDINAVSDDCTALVY